MVLLPPKQRTHPAWVGWYFCAQWFKKFLCQCLSYMVAPCRFSVMHMHLICKAFYLYKFNCASWTTPSHLMNYPKRLPLFPVHPFVSSAEPKCSDFLSFPNAQLKCLIPPPLSKFIGLHGFWGSGCTLRGNGLGKKPSKSETPHLNPSCWHPGKAMDLGQAAPKQLHILLHSSEVILKGTGFPAHPQIGRHQTFGLEIPLMILQCTGSQRHVVLCYLSM